MLSPSRSLNTALGPAELGDDDAELGEPDMLDVLDVAAAGLLLLFGGAKFIWYVGEVGSPALGVPKSWWYGAGGIGLLLIALHSLINLYQVVVTGKPIPRETAMEEEALHLELEGGK